MKCSSATQVTQADGTSLTCSHSNVLANNNDDRLRTAIEKCISKGNNCIGVLGEKGCDNTKLDVTHYTLCDSGTAFTLCTQCKVGQKISIQSK